MFLPLAERMAEKYATEGKIEAEAEVIIYVMILEMLEKHEKVLEVLSGPLASKFKVLNDWLFLCARSLLSFLDRCTGDADFVETKRAELLSALQRWKEAQEAYVEMLKTRQE